MTIPTPEEVHHKAQERYHLDAEFHDRVERAAHLFEAAVKFEEIVPDLWASLQNVIRAAISTALYIDDHNRKLREAALKLQPHIP